MTWYADLGAFNDALQVTYLLIGIFIVIYFVEFFVTALEFGFSKSFTTLFIIGLSILIIGWWLLKAVGIPFCTYPTTVIEEGFEVAKVAVEYSFVIFYVIILFGVVFSLVIAARFFKRYFEERMVLEKVGEYAMDVEGIVSDVNLIKERVPTDDDGMKSIHNESDGYKREYEEIEKR